jgi:sugar lactone lactonase YvrE
MKQMLALVVFIILMSKIYSQVTDFNLSTSINTDGLFPDNDTLYVVEGWSGSHLFKILPDGSITIYASGLSGPIDLVRRSNGNFYVSEWNSARISEVTPMGLVSTYVNIQPGPGPMTMDENENIFVTHNMNNGSGFITKIDTAGVATIIFSGEPLINPGGIALDEQDNMYVANFNNGNIIKVSPNMNSTILATIPVSGTWKTGHMKYHAGLLYVNSLAGNKVFSVDTTGQVSVFAGSGINGHQGGTLDEAQFSNPDGICISPDGLEFFVAKGLASVNYLQKIDLTVTSLSEKVKKPIQSIHIAPNPFYLTTSIHFTLNEEAFVSLSIYDLQGKKVEQLINNTLNAGNHSVLFSAKNIPDGFYFYQLATNKFVETKKMLLKR